MGASPMPVSLRSKFPKPTAGSKLDLVVSNVELLRNLVFFFFLLRITRKSFYQLRGRGILGSLTDLYAYLRLRSYKIFLNLPGVKSKVDAQVAATIATLETKLVPSGPGVVRHLKLPTEGWTDDDVRNELTRLAEMEHTKWEEGFVSGAVYHGGSELLKLQSEAFDKFGVANPIHPDVFPGVRKMEAEVVAMVLDLFNAPETGAGVTTSGGTESILMACLSARQKAFYERGVKEPEMIIPHTAHAAFYKACNYFKIKLHIVDCPAPGYTVHIPSVKRLINPNTVLLVGSAPNFPHGLVDDIPALSRLAVAHKIPLHVDCCLGSFLMPFLARAGYPSPYAEYGGFDFKNPGVTSISVDTHKYGFAPKGNSVVLYRNKTLRSYQYFICPAWSGGVYGSPNMAGSRPGALIAGAWASLMSQGESGYLNSCTKIVGTAKKIEHAIRTDTSLNHVLSVVGDPLVSVVAFQSSSDELDIYDVADAMNTAGWHLNALQDPPAIHIAVTLPTTTAVDKLIEDLKAVVGKELEKIEELKKQGIKVEKKRGDTSALYGVAGSLPDKSVVEKLAVGFLDTLYKA